MHPSYARNRQKKKHFSRLTTLSGSKLRVHPMMHVVILGNIWPAGWVVSPSRPTRQPFSMGNFLGHGKCLTAIFRPRDWAKRTSSTSLHCPPRLLCTLVRVTLRLSARASVRPLPIGNAYASQLVDSVAEGAGAKGDWRSESGWPDLLSYHLFVS